jgi:hypothetical protein
VSGPGALLLAIGDGWHGQTGTVSIKTRQYLTPVKKRPISRMQFNSLCNRNRLTDTFARIN